MIKFLHSLHEYMMNKHRIELIQWFGNVKSFVENEKDFYLFLFVYLFYSVFC